MVVFLRGCNFKCCYCQNYRIWGLALPVRSDGLLLEIQRNKGYVGALVFSGGEPTLRPNLLQILAQEAKREGLLVGIETNGSYPEVLKTLIASGLIDGLFVDLKAPLSNPRKYARIVGIADVGLSLEKIKQTIEIGRAALAANELIAFELRTTLFKGLLHQDEIVEMVNEFRDIAYVLQQGRTEVCPRKNLTALTRAELIELAVQCRRPLRVRTLENGDENVD
jgi:pyruvate formate lyase activating enzyme